MEKLISLSNPNNSNTPAYIIAEAGVNHNGDLNLALELVKKAKEVGADCVKFQTFTAARIITKTAPKAEYQLKVTDEKESQFEMLQKLELQKNDYLKIMKLCKELKIDFLSTPYNREDADFLNELGVEAFKIASGQIIEIDFLRHVAHYKKPIILSTGMANLAEVYQGVKVIRDEGNNNLILLQCTSNYPSKTEDAHVNAMVTMGKALDITVGYSDHVPNNYPAYASVALGAKVIEKHFTLDNKMPGPDHSASLEPKDFKILCDGIRAIEAALGSPIKQPTEVERRNAVGMRRSIVASRDIKEGEVFTRENISFKRPGTGMKPQEYEKILGKTAVKDISLDTLLSEGLISW